MKEQEQLIKDWLKYKYPEYTYRSHYEAIDAQGYNYLHVNTEAGGERFIEKVSILDLIAFVYSKKC